MTLAARHPTPQRAAAIQRAFQGALGHSRAGDAARWKVCWCAVVVVGQREKGLTLSLARRLNRSPDTVESMDRAALTYLTLYWAFRGDRVVCARLRQIHKALTWSHFAAIGRPLKAETIDPLEAFAALDVAADNGSSVADMMGHETGANGNGWVEVKVWTADQEPFVLPEGQIFILLSDEWRGLDRVRVKA